MAIVNLFGTNEEINKLRNIMNGVSEVYNNDVNVGDGSVRSNSNTDLPTTFARLVDGGAKVGHSEFKRDNSYVTEAVASFDRKLL